MIQLPRLCSSLATQIPRHYGFNCPNYALFASIICCSRSSLSIPCLFINVMQGYVIGLVGFLGSEEECDDSCVRGRGHCRNENSHGRHGHRLNLWRDDNQQGGGSNARVVPQGLEDLLLYQLRRQTTERTSGVSISEQPPAPQTLTSDDEIRSLVALRWWFASYVRCWHEKGCGSSGLLVFCIQSCG